MLWVVFNKNGQYIADYNTGNIPVAGTNDFQIFAYFKDLSNLYSTASIKLYKPSRNNESYRPLCMTHTFETFEGTTNSELTNNQTYPGFLFNFTPVGTQPLLDTAGLWKAVVTLYASNNSGLRNVVGILTFSVANGIISLDGTQITEEDFADKMYATLATKLDINGSFDPKYIKTIDSITNINNEGLTELLSANDIVYSRVNDSFYKLSGTSGNFTYTLIPIQGGGGGGDSVNKIVYIDETVNSGTFTNDEVSTLQFFDDSMIVAQQITDNIVRVKRIFVKSRQLRNSNGDVVAMFFTGVEATPLSRDGYTYYTHEVININVSAVDSSGIWHRNSIEVDFYDKSQSEAKFVDLTSPQTISGKKTFTKDINVVSDNYYTRRIIATNYENDHSGYAKTYLEPDGISIGRYSSGGNLSNLNIYAYPDDDGTYRARISNKIYAYDPSVGDNAEITYNYELPRGSGTLALQTDAPSYQSTSVVVINAVTNLNGRVFQNFTAELRTDNTYTYYQIFYDGQDEMSESRASQYMHYMTGSYFVPKYNYDFPKQTLFVFADGSVWKPQFDASTGLRLYRISTVTTLYKHTIFVTLNSITLINLVIINTSSTAIPAYKQNVADAINNCIKCYYSDNSGVVTGCKVTGSLNPTFTIYKIYETNLTSDTVTTIGSDTVTEL